MIEIDNDFQKKLGGRKVFEYFMKIQGEVYRDFDGRRTQRFFIDGEGFFIKQHFGIGWKEIFKNLMQLKLPVIGAKTEYTAIKYLKKLQIDTMDIVGFSQQGINPAHIQSFLITKELDGTISLEDYCSTWLKRPPAYKEKQILLQKVASIVKKMHENGMNHRDLYICHFLMKKHPNIFDECRLFVIDLHRAQIRTAVPERWIIKDLSALYFSAMHIGLTKRDFLRFINIYRGKDLRCLFDDERLFWDKVERKAYLLDGLPNREKNR